MRKVKAKVLRAWTFLLMVGMSAICAPLLAQLSPTPPLADPATTLTPKQAATFQSALQAVASQAHMGIVAEAAPLQKRLSATPLPSFPPNSPASVVLGGVADAYDYDVQRQGSLFVLLKRYSDPNDLPDVTPEECTLALDDMAQVMSFLNPGPPESGRGPYITPQLVSIAATLTPAQFQAMEQRTSDKGLSVASLSDEQQSMVRRFALTSYVYDPWADVQGALYRLRQAATTTLAVEKSRQISTRTTRMGDEPPITLTAVQDTAFGFNMRDIYGRLFFTQMDENMAFIAATSNQPPASPLAARPVPPGSDRGYTTLGAVVQGLNARGARVTMLPALQAKTLTVYGTDAVAPEQLLKAIATVYGLRYVKEKDGRKRLTRPEISIPLAVEGLPDAVRRVLPSPLLRAMHDGELEKANNQEKWIREKTLKTQADFIKMGQEQYQLQKRCLEMRSLSVTLHRVAVARLRAAFDTELIKQWGPVKAQSASGQPVKQIPLSALPAEARAAFAVALTTTAMDDVIHSLGQKAPAWAADMNACYLTGGLHPNPTRPGVQTFSMTVSTANADGALVGGTGTSTDFP